MTVFKFSTPEEAQEALAEARDLGWSGQATFEGFCAWAVDNHQKYTQFDMSKYEYRTGMQDPEEEQIEAMAADYRKSV